MAKIFVEETVSIDRDADIFPLITSVLTSAGWVEEYSKSQYLHKYINANYTYEGNSYTWNPYFYSGTLKVFKAPTGDRWLGLYLHNYSCCDSTKIVVSAIQPDYSSDDVGTIISNMFLANDGINEEPRSIVKTIPAMTFGISTRKITLMASDKLFLYRFDDSNNCLIWYRDSEHNIDFLKIPSDVSTLNDFNFMINGYRRPRSKLVKIDYGVGSYTDEILVKPYHYLINNELMLKKDIPNTELFYVVPGNKTKLYPGDKINDGLNTYTVFDTNIVVKD